MLLDEISKLNISLARFLTTFKDCFRSVKTYQHLESYVKGQLSKLRRKTVDHLARYSETPARTLQEFLEHLKWDEREAIKCCQSYVGRKHSGEQESIGVLDFTYHTKHGKQTAGVKHQYNGEAGKRGNCVISCHLAYVSGEFYTLLDSELYLPEEWTEDEEKRKEANIPLKKEFPDKAELATGQIKEASKRVNFDWINFDSEFGRMPRVLKGLEEMNQPYVGEIPENTPAWKNRPTVIEEEENWDRPGPKPELPVVKPEHREAPKVKQLLEEDPSLTEQEWTPYHIKKTKKGPKLWEVKTTWIYHKREGLPSEKR